MQSDFACIFVQIKGETVRRIDVRDSEWKEIWRIDTKTSVSFSKLTICEAEQVIAFPSATQDTLSLARIPDGVVVKSLSLSKNTPPAAGMIVCMVKSQEQCENTRLNALTESGHIVSLNPTNGEVISIRKVEFPSDSTVDSVIPTAMMNVGNGDWLIGFSNGIVSRLEDASEWYQDSQRPGISCMLACGDDILLATWKGTLCILNKDGKVVQRPRSPHSCSISHVSVSGNRVAVGSTDGRVSIWELAYTEL
jgi:WD40 repeat protein